MGEPIREMPFEGLSVRDVLECTKIGNWVSVTMDTEVRLKYRIIIKLHMLMCKHCKAFDGSMKWLREYIHTVSDERFNDVRYDLPCLPDNAKARISAALSNGEPSER
ncbi:MAG: hypothetical protein CL946_12050 [Ectothiorhodospiraceae bacterium]|nr:hypothetical protein [Ectothiorhodospiraceae bacterium]